ncbi:MAG TPA: tryptophan--tRNA ligase, partial [Thermoleophilaceae bacterium]
PTLGASIMDLQEPDVKMSTSSSTENGLIYIDDEPEAILKKVKRAQTDSDARVVRAPDKPGVTNLIDMLAVARDTTPERIEQEFDGQGYGAFKDAVGEALVEMLTPVRERYRELRADEAAIETALKRGAEQARAIAAGTMDEVRAAMGIGRPPV